MTGLAPLGPLPRRIRWGLLAGIFLLAAAGRMAVVWSGVAPVAGDSSSYVLPAKNLAAGRGYVDELGAPYTFRPPTYPLFLAAIFWGVGESLRTVRFVQAVLASAGAAALAYWLGGRHGPGPGLAAGVLLALDPILIPVPAFVLTEALGTLLVPAVVVCLDHGLATRRRRYLLLAGALGGAAALNTPITLLLVPWLLLTARIARSPRRPDWQSWVLPLAMVAAVLGSWTARNYREDGRAIVVREGGFASLIWATTEYDFPWLPSSDDPAWAEIVRKHDEILAGRTYGQAHTDFLRAAWRNVREAPLRVLLRVARANVWFWIEAPGSHLRRDGRLARWLTLGFHQFQLLALLGSLWFLRRWGRLREWALWISTMLYFALFLGLMMPIPRYYIPLLPVMDALVAGGLALRTARGQAPAAANPEAWRHG